ncbi:jg19682, partial [Pararge aegeria aegeria]
KLGTTIKLVTDIQICNVKPVTSRRNWPSGAPEQVKRFYACNDVDTFLCDRPLHKPPIDKENEFKSLWIERTTLVTENTLPGILRWSEVISRSMEEIPPVEVRTLHFSNFSYLFITF